MTKGMDVEVGVVCRPAVVRPPLSVQDHHLLWVADPRRHPEQVATAAGEGAMALYRVLAAAEQPRTAGEVAARMRLSRSVVALWATELVRLGAVCRSATAMVPGHRLGERMLRGLEQRRAPDTVKLVLAGAPGSGKTTFLGAVADYPPVQDVVLVPQAADRAEAAPRVAVSVDIGRLALAEDLVVTFVSHPGQPGCAFMWDCVAREAAGAIVLVDPGRVGEAEPAVQALQQREVPIVLALNPPPVNASPAHAVRMRLGVEPEVPVVACDARTPVEARDVLQVLAHHLASGARVPVGTEVQWTEQTQSGGSW